MDLLPVTKREMLAEVEREIALRKRVYPRLVSDRKMTQAKADRQMEVMVAVAVFLSDVQEMA